jgi:ferredoxin-type protein NapF
MPSAHQGRPGTRAKRAPDLRAFVTPEDTSLRPPWSRVGDAFDQACTRCGKCADACPTHVLRIENGRLRVDYADGECTFCGACATVCPEPAFDMAALAANARPWNVGARIDNTCLARLGVECSSCGDACEAHAIRFRVHGGSLPDPRVDPHLCTGCGACVRVCPASAITVVARKPPAALA